MDSIAQRLQDSFSDNDDSFIELELDHSAPTCFGYEDHKSELNLNESGFAAGAECEEYELRISISSTIPLPLVEESPTETITASSTASLISYSANNSGNFTDSPSLPLNHSSLSQTGQRPGVNRPFEVFWENRQSENNMDLLYSTSSRKQPSMTTTNGGMMKLLVKFRAIKIRTLLASLVKPRQPCQANKGQKTSSNRKSKTILQCYQRSLVNPSGSDGGRKSKNWGLDDNGSIGDSLRSSKRSNRVLEIDLGALRGMFSAVGQGVSIAPKGGSKRRSCSTSCNNSPIHEGFSICSSDNSNIQAAIAYCKSSFGQTSDFSF